MPRLYCPALTTGVVSLSPEESHHAASVLRLAQGDRVVLFDGAGFEAEGEVESADRRQLRVSTKRIEQFPFDAPVRTTLAVALPKANRQAFLVEKCTELGVAAVWPLICDHAVVKAGVGGVERLRRRAIEAAKQCGRKWLPDIRPAMSFAACCQSWSEFDCVGMAHPGADDGGLCTLLRASPRPTRVLVMIGPEGGWSAAELDSAREGKAQLIGLGPTILRTETAALAACAALLLSAGTPEGPHRG